MTIRDLPSADLTVRPGVRSDVSQKALSHWCPDIRAQGGDDATISILDVIGKDFWDDGVTAKRVSGALRRIGDQPVTVVINSPGGDVFEGLAIYNLLREHPAEVTVKVIGIAASAASFIAMAGDRIEVARSGFFMIHNAWVVAMGDKEALRETADWLAPFDGAMVDIYADRTEHSEDELVAMMKREAWINGTEAVDQGFADDFLPRDQITVADDDEKTQAKRTDRAFDVLAAKAGMSRREGRALFSEIKNGGKPGAALTGELDAAELTAGIREIIEN